MELETVNKLFLELSQVATAQTAKELALTVALKDVAGKLSSALEIAKRDGKETNWPAFRNQAKLALQVAHLILFPSVSESGWVIEQDESEGSAPRYFTGNSHPAMRWSDPGDHAAAIRFSRKEDAEKMRLAVDGARKHRVAEHSWDAPILPPAETCQRCDGKGATASDRMMQQECPNCLGTGKVRS